MASKSRRIVSMRTAQRSIYGLSAGLLVAAVVMQFAMFNSADFDSVNWTAIIAIAVLMVIADNVEIDVVIGRQTMTFNTIEVPLVLSLFWVPPLVFVLLRIPLTIFTYAFRRRLAPLKTFLNIAVIYFEASFATYVFRSFDVADPANPLAWAATFGGVIPANIVGMVAVGLAISLVQGRMTGEQLRHASLSIAGAGLINPTLGLVILIAISVSPWSAVLLVVLGIVLLAGYRLYSTSSRHFRTIGDLYELTRSIDGARQEGSLADILLVRSRELLGAEAAALWLPRQGRYPEMSLRARENESAVADDLRGGDDPIRRHVLASGLTVALSTMKSKLPAVDPALHRALVERGDKDIIAVPLRSGSAVIGCLEVTGRLGELSTFTSDEVRLLEMLASHAAVALENSRLVDRLRHDAYHDALTGLPNRRRFLTALETAIAVTPAPSEVVAVMQFDVDSLRDVNETLGHEAGDRLLIEVGRRLNAEAPDGALVARLGGDEFGVLLRAQGSEMAQTHALALQRSLVEPMRLDQFTLDVGAAVGIVLFPEHGPDAATLMRRMDVATYAAKHNPRSIQLYRNAMESRSLHRLELVSELRRALDDEALTVYYQPKVDLKSNELIGMECLVRWEHPEHGLVSPDDFIPVAEHTGLVGSLTRFVLRTALAQCRVWHEQGRMLGVSVNLSARSLTDTEFTDDLQILLAESGVAPDQLTLEITESAMVGESGRPLPTLDLLHSMGVRLSVDDFGTGYSSLSYLRRLPVHEVKIDKSFVLGMATDTSDSGIVRSIVDLGHHLGIRVVAEGVESEMTVSLLEEMGCDFAQGFLFSRPLPAERIEAWMVVRTERGRDTMDGVGHHLRLVG